MKQELLQKYLDIAGVMFVALNKKGEVSLINRKGCETLGYEENELLGKNWFDLCIPEQSRDELRNVFERLMSGDVKPVEYYDNAVITKSGEERIISWHNTVLEDKNGKPEGTLSSGLDITERNKTGRLLRESETRIRAIVETAVDGIITINEKGVIESVNTAVERLFGYTADELLGQNIEKLMPSPHREEHNTHIGNYLKTGKKKIIGIGREVIGRRKDGNTIPLHLSVSEFSVENKRMFTGILRDISEQKTLQQKILQSERLAIIGKMAAKVAHEVRNPLSSISLNAELLEDEIQNLGPCDTEEARSLLKSMIKEIDRVTALTEEYLQFSRLPESRLLRGNFEELVSEIAQFLKEELKQKNIEFEFLPSNEPIEVRFDRTQFRRVILNIIRNAIESMPKGGKLKIWLKKTAKHGVINIQDTGIGIPEDMVENIFNPFFTTKMFGTGLGLAITQQVIEEHGGQIYCKSKVKEGTTFRIELPLDTNE